MRHHYVAHRRSDEVSEGKAVEVDRGIGQGRRGALDVSISPRIHLHLPLTHISKIAGEAQKRSSPWGRRSEPYLIVCPVAGLGARDRNGGCYHPSSLKT
jgi:hypothetical protein